MSLRLRCKVIEYLGKPALVSHALLSPSSFSIVAYATRRQDEMLVFLMRDDLDAPSIRMTVDEYNALPYYWFEMGEPAPKMSAIKPVPL